MKIQEIIQRIPFVRSLSARRAFLMSITLILLSGCTCCLYLNHYYNAEKYFDKAVDLKKERLELNPQDSAWTTNDEKANLNKAIEKCSAILERWPGEADYKPKVLFIMGESFLKLGNWVQAIQKYDEYLKYFPQGEDVPTIEFNKAFALARSGQASLARFALTPIVQNPEHPWHHQALALLAKLQLGNDDPDDAIATLEALLKLKDGNTRLRAQAFYQLGALYFQVKKYDLSRERYRAKEIAELGNNVQYQALFAGAKSAYTAKQYALAIQDLQGILSDKQYQAYKIPTELRLAQYFILNKEFNQGLDILNRIKVEHARSGVAAEAYFWIADYHELARQDYTQAMLNYDSAVTSEPKSPYGIKASEKLKTLRRLTTWHKDKKAGPLTADQNFQIAELFLFELNQTDSALNILDSIIHQENQDPAIKMRAAYAQAFITDEFTENQQATDSLYNWIIKTFPKSTYAKQAQKNLGLPVTIVTSDDEAKAKYVAAEKAYDELKKQSSLDATTFDSLELEAFALFDSIAQNYPMAPEAPQAMFFKAFIYETEHFDHTKAREQYQMILDQYPNSPWGRRAKEKIDAKITDLTPKKMTQIRQDYERSIQEFDRRLVQIKNRRQADVDREIRKQKDEEKEELLWDYNDMYDIGQ